MRSALLLIDVQRIYTTEGSPLYVEGHETAIRNMNRLIDQAISRGDLVVYVRHVHKSDGSDAGRMFDHLGSVSGLGFTKGTDRVALDPRLHLDPVGIHIVKNRYSAFVRTSLDYMLWARGVERIAVTGFMTNYCCEATARHAHDLDYLVDFIIDATGCPDVSGDLKQQQVKSVVATVLQGAFARVFKTDEYLIA